MFHTFTAVFCNESTGAHAVKGLPSFSASSTILARGRMTKTNLLRATQYGAIIGDIADQQKTKT